MNNNKKNYEIRQLAKERDVKLWEIAERLGCADASLSRKLRFELPVEEKKRILDIIDEISENKEPIKSIERERSSRSLDWIPVSDRMPSFHIRTIKEFDRIDHFFVSDDVLLCTSSGYVFIGFAEKNTEDGKPSWGSCCESIDDQEEIKFWMPIPNPPDER